MDYRRMMKRCQQLPLPEESIPPPRTLSSGAQELDRHAMFDLAICALGQIDASHPASPDQRKNAIAPDNVSGRWFMREAQRQHNALDRVFEKGFGITGI